MRFCRKLRDILRIDRKYRFININEKYWEKMKSNDYFSILIKKLTKVLQKSNFRNFL